MTSKRTRRVELQLTEDEYSLFKIKADQQGLPLAVWIRLQAVGEALIYVCCPHCSHEVGDIADNGWTAIVCSECQREIRRSEVGR